MRSCSERARTKEWPMFGGLKTTSSKIEERACVWQWVYNGKRKEIWNLRIDLQDFGSIQCLAVDRRKLSWRQGRGLAKAPQNGAPPTQCSLPDDYCGAGFCLMYTDFSSSHDSTALEPFDRPIPDPLYPPNGSSYESNGEVQLTPTLPASRPRATRSAVSTFEVKTEAYNPSAEAAQHCYDRHALRTYTQSRSPLPGLLPPSRTRAGPVPARIPPRC